MHDKIDTQHNQGEVIQKVRRLTTAEHFDQIEAEVRKDKPVGKRRPKGYRQPIQVIHDALKTLQNPTPRHKVLQSYNTDRAFMMFKQMIMQGLIQPTDIAREWVITDKGQILLKELNKLFKEYPFLITGEEPSAGTIKGNRNPLIPID